MSKKEKARQLIGGLVRFKHQKLWNKISKPVIARRKNLTTEAQIIEVMSWMLDIPISQLYPYAHLKDDLYLDSFDIDMLIAKLESRFGVFLTPEEVANIETVHDAASYFSTKHAA